LRSVWAKKLDPIRKITKAKRAGGMAQMVEHLPSKSEALNSNPSSASQLPPKHMYFRFNWEN
jgi:hypothetical protein